MNILLVLLLSLVFVLVVIIIPCYKSEVGTLSKRLRNNVHFYVARDANGLLCLYSGKPKRSIQVFFVGYWGEIITSGNGFSNYGLDIKDYANLKWEDEPVEVFLNLEN